MKNIKRFICILLAVLFVLTAASCKKAEEVAVMTLGDSVVTENMYSYWLSSYKANFLTSYEDVSDTEEFWSSTITDGLTAEEFLSQLILEYVQMDLVAMYLFDEFGLKVTSEDKKAAENIVADLLEYAGGNKTVFNQALSAYGVNYNMLCDIYLQEFKSTYVYDHVFENNVLIVDDTVKQEYLEENYARVRHIYINDAYDTEKSAYDADGNFIMEPLDESTQTEKDKKVADALSALENGTAFDTVYEEYSEEKAYDNGYYLSASTTGLPTELITNAFKTEIGETATFKSQYGTHIIMRLEMDSAPYENEANSDFFEDFTDAVYENTFMEYIRSYFDKIEINTEVLSSYSIRDALPNYSFQY